LTAPARTAADVVIVGAGVAGLASANELLAAGRSVCVLEREHVGAGASHGNCGLVTPSHATPLTQPGTLRKLLGWMLRPDAPVYIKPRLDFSLLTWGLRFARACGREAMLQTLRARAAILQSSRALFDEWIERDGLQCEWDTLGLLLVYTSSEGVETEHALHAELREHAIEAIALDARELVQRDPALRDDLAGGAWYPGDAHLRPDRYVAELARLVRARGGELIEGCDVRAVRTSGRRVEALDT